MAAVLGVILVGTPPRELNSEGCCGDLVVAMRAATEGGCWFTKVRSSRTARKVGKAERDKAGHRRG
jgi:hypothetical protein